MNATLFKALRGLGASRHPVCGSVLLFLRERTLSSFLQPLGRRTRQQYVRNADVPGIMASMVMDYRVKDQASLAGIKPGDIIQATMVMDGGNWLEDIKVTGKR